MSFTRVTRQETLGDYKFLTDGFRIMNPKERVELETDKLHFGFIRSYSYRALLALGYQ